jgi:PhzF family phenazine biosynthesis protein
LVAADGSLFPNNAAGSFMIVPYFEVVAFTSRQFAGNPAAVCLLSGAWLPDELMQRIAAENNLPATAFLVDHDTNFDLRWLTPTVELDLCGHATLAAAHVIFNHLDRKTDAIHFQSRRAGLRVDKTMDKLMLDFPAEPATECKPPSRLQEGLRAQPRMVLKGRDYLAVFERERDVAAINPDFGLIARLDSRGLIVTAPGDDCDFISRYFAPAVGIPEDSVTGSTHCALIPYWSNRLSKKELYARQISRRGGELLCQDRGERVGIGGSAVTYIVGELHVSV